MKIEINLINKDRCDSCPLYTRFHKYIEGTNGYFYGLCGAKIPLGNEIKGVMPRPQECKDKYGE